MSRDAFIAETAVVIDRLTAKIERLERREELLTNQISDLVALAHQSSRFQALAESLRNARDYKLEQMVHRINDVKTRLETMEGPRSEYNQLVHRSFVAVDKVLSEIAGRDARRSRVRRRVFAVLTGVVCAAVLVIVPGATGIL